MLVIHPLYQQGHTHPQGGLSGFYLIQRLCTRTRDPLEERTVLPHDFYCFDLDLWGVRLVHSEEPLVMGYRSPFLPGTWHDLGWELWSFGGNLDMTM